MHLILVDDIHVAGTFLKPKVHPRPAELTKYLPITVTTDPPNVEPRETDNFCTIGTRTYVSVKLWPLDTAKMPPLKTCKTDVEPASRGGLLQTTMSGETKRAGTSVASNLQNVEFCRNPLPLTVSLVPFGLLTRGETATTDGALANVNAVALVSATRPRASLKVT